MKSVYELICVRYFLYIYIYICDVCVWGGGVTFDKKFN